MFFDYSKFKSHEFYQRAKKQKQKKILSSSYVRLVTLSFVYKHSWGQLFLMASCVSKVSNITYNQNDDSFVAS